MGNLTFEVLGVGNPFIDHVIQITEQEFELIPGAKGGMVQVDYPLLQEIIAQTGKEPIIVLGGSGANTIRGLAHLGHRCALVGRVGQDLHGKRFLARLKELGITSFLVETTTPTGQAVCLITPDQERTMRSFLGASAEMCGGDLEPELFQGAKLVHVEGYSLLNEALSEQSMRYAKLAKARVSFDLGSYEVVQLHQQTILMLLKNYVDLVFANRQEVMALTEKDPETGCRALSKLCKIAVVLLGKEGCLVATEGKLFHHPAFPVEAIDTTGAGDFFISGFLHGYLKGYPLKECAKWGARLGAEVVQVHGVDLPADVWKNLVNHRAHREHREGF